MALPSSGTISISQIRTELGTSDGSLRNLSALAGKSTPDAMSEFYGYSACPPSGTYYTQYCDGTSLYYTYHNGSCGYYDSLYQANSPTCGYTECIYYICTTAGYYYYFGCSVNSGFNYEYFEYGQGVCVSGTGISQSAFYDTGNRCLV